MDRVAQIVGTTLVFIFLAGTLTDADGRRRGGRRVSLGSGVEHGQRVTGPVLTRAELADCLALQDIIAERSDELDEKEAMIDRMRVRLSRTDPIAVDDFNDQVGFFNEAATRLDRTIQLFNSACANKSYYSSDLEPARAESRKPVHSPSSGPGPETIIQCSPTSVLGPMVCPDVRR